MAVSAAAQLEKNREAVDALNVFPVPDGDTGTNMSLTMMSASREISSKEYVNAGEAAAALAKGALRGARGNSGVILSQLFRGFSRALEGVEKISPVQFAQALQAGAEVAYKAVMRPKEGTILTVARVIAEEAVKQAQSAPNDYDALMRVILASGENILKLTTVGREALADTVNQNPVLKKAGVVDAGGRGLLCIYAGYAAALGGEHIDLAPVDAAAPVEDFVDDHDEESKYTYCTQFLIQHLRMDAKPSDIATFRRHLNRIGDCVLVVGDLSLIKVHVHTNDPGKALQYGLQLGELSDFIIENMVEQHRQKQAQKARENPPKEYGMVSVAQGAGIAGIFKDLGVDVIVEGGQTMNPAIEDLQNAIDSINAKNIFVLPNNGNVILAAQQAAELSDKHVVVLPTKNVAMGISAVVSFQPDLSPEENAANMDEAAQRVRTGMITYAVRDTNFDNRYMLRMLGRLGFVYCGKVRYRSGERLAFEKTLGT